MNSLSHVAIIMDGNGRWAQLRNKPRSYGHKYGVKNIKNIIECCIKKKIKYLTLFAFAKNNFKRSKTEVFFLFNLLENYLKKNIKFLIQNKIKLKVIGEKQNLKSKLINSIKDVEIKTKKFDNLTIFLAFNYSSKVEICNSVKKLIKQKKIISTKSISKYLYSGNIPDPQILVRTGGYNRLSDFFLWQISYSEIFFKKKLWPDFQSKDLLKIFNAFKKIKRNFGAANE